MGTKLLKTILVASVSPLLLSGCIFGSNDDDDNPGCELALGSNVCNAGPKSCTSITGGSTSVAFSQSSCPSCTIDNAPRAIDGSQESFASMTLPGLTIGSAALKATSQSGLVFPAGQTAAVVLTDGPAYSRLHLRTYLASVLQEQTSGSTVTQENLTIFGFKTTKQFDAVELSVDGAATSTAEVVQIREFCSDGVVDPFPR